MKKAFQKLAVLSHLENYLEPEERALIFNSIIKSQFTYRNYSNLVYSNLVRI